MPSASSYTSKLRALTDARNVKVQNEDNTVNTNRPLLPITCNIDLVPSVVTVARQLASPTYMCKDTHGNLFVIDSIGIRKIDMYKTVTTLLELPNKQVYGLAISSNNTLYVSLVPTSGSVVYEIWAVNSVTGSYTVSVSYDNNGSAFGICIDANNRMYIARRNGSVNFIEIRNIPTIGIISTTFTTTNQPFFVSVQGNTLYITFGTFGNPISNTTLDAYTLSGTYINQVSTLSSIRFVYPDPYGHVYICAGNGIYLDGQLVVGGGTSYNDEGSPLSVQITPGSLLFLNELLYFTDTGNNAVRNIVNVYRPAWWTPIEFQKACQVCNAFIITPPPPPPPPPTATYSINQFNIPSTITFDTCIILKLTIYKGSGINGVTFCNPSYNGTLVAINSIVNDATNEAFTFTTQSDNVDGFKYFLSNVTLPSGVTLRIEFASIANTFYNLHDNAAIFLY